jgi:beta-galactosidase
MRGRCAIALVIGMSLAGGRALARPASDPPPFETILYGASYYLEYMPRERLEEDVELMKKAGFSFVRVGESSWGVLEPEDGRFDFAWLERVVDKMHEAGIRVILGTPTYSIPAWLYKRHPEIQVKPLGQPRYAYGLRQMSDLTHPVYRRYAERIIRRLVGRFRDHPAVIGYQLDNETHPSGTADDHVQKAFRDHLQACFKTPEAQQIPKLNYWGQRVNSFDEVPPRDGILNPGYKLEWSGSSRRSPRTSVPQASAVRELRRLAPSPTISWRLPSDVDQFEVARSDVPAERSFHDPDGMTGEEIAFRDINRSLRAEYLVAGNDGPDDWLGLVCSSRPTTDSRSRFTRTF